MILKVCLYYRWHSNKILPNCNTDALIKSSFQRHLTDHFCLPVVFIVITSKSKSQITVASGGAFMQAFASFVLEMGHTVGIVKALWWHVCDIQNWWVRVLRYSLSEWCQIKATCVTVGRASTAGGPFTAGPPWSTILTHCWLNHYHWECRGQ